MVNASTPASFTKNLGLGDDYSALYAAVRSGFAHKAEPVAARTWRARSGMSSHDQQLIPMRFFLYSAKLDDDDYLMADEFVWRCISQEYNNQIAKLAFFALNLAKSGFFRKTKWPNGRIAGWANDFIRTVVWRNGAWQAEKFSDSKMESFILDNIIGSKEAKHKVFTNYRHLLRISGFYIPEMRSGPLAFQAGSWATSGCKLFWDRSMYSGEIGEHANQEQLVSAFLESEVFKLLGCSETQGRSLAQVAAAEFVRDGRVLRFLR